MLKAVIFDVYGTLLSTGTSSVDAARSILKLRGSGLDPVDFYTQWKSLHKRRMRESFFAPERELFARDLEELYTLHRIEGNAGEDVSLMLSALTRREAFPDAAPALRYLRRYYRVLMGSNTDEAPLRAGLRENGLTADGVYTSEELRCYKPDPAFYRAICEREELFPEECVFIGDSLEEDVDGPKGAGMQAVLLDRKGIYRPLPGLAEPDRILTQLPTERRPPWN